MTWRCVPGQILCDPSLVNQFTSCMHQGSPGGSCSVHYWLFKSSILYQRPIGPHSSYFSSYSVRKIQLLYHPEQWVAVKNRQVNLCWSLYNGSSRVQNWLSRSSRTKSFQLCERKKMTWSLLWVILFSLAVFCTLHSKWQLKRMKFVQASVLQEIVASLPPDESQVQVCSRTPGPLRVPSIWHSI